jgi:hypothetical protein
MALLKRVVDTLVYVSIPGPNGSVRGAISIAKGFRSSWVLIWVFCASPRNWWAKAPWAKVAPVLSSRKLCEFENTSALGTAPPMPCRRPSGANLTLGTRRSAGQTAGMGAKGSSDSGNPSMAVDGKPTSLGFVVFAGGA